MRSGRTDGVLSVLDGLVHDGSASLGSAVGSHLDVGSDDGSSRSEEILEILPVGLERKLMKTNNERERGERSGRETSRHGGETRRRTRRPFFKREKKGCGIDSRFRRKPVVLLPQEHLPFLLRTQELLRSQRLPFDQQKEELRIELAPLGPERRKRRREEKKTEGQPEPEVVAIDEGREWAPKKWQERDEPLG